MKPIALREADFKKEVAKFTFPEIIKTEFFEYWSEPNKSNTKMRFEMEKTWHLGRRLARWANNGFNSTKNTQKVEVKKVEVKTPVTEIEHLDSLLAKYRAKFESVKFEEFGKWYEYLKKERLLRQFTKEDVQIIQASYNNDRDKCRCAAVKMTFDSYINTDFTFGRIMEIRERLK